MGKFDILIPIDMPKEAGFIGKSGRGGNAVNNEVSFQFGSRAASYHRMNGRAYIVVRVGLNSDEVRNLWPSLRVMIAKAAATLDISLRPVEGQFAILTSGERAGLSNISIFPSGEVPLVYFKDESYGIQLPVAMLSEAIGDDVLDSEIGEALRIFADVDFEATVTSRFVLLSTILELLAKRERRDEQALAILAKWIEQARAASRGDLVQALTLMQDESIGSAIARLVEEGALEAGCSKEEAIRFQKLARAAYRKRGALLHAGVYVTVEELASLRSIVRLLLKRETKPTPFTPIGNKLWD